MFKKLFSFLFPLFVLGILTGANIYLSYRFAWSFGIEKIWLLNLSFGLLVVFMVAGMIAFSNSIRLAGSITYCTAAVTMGFLLYLLLSTLLVDLVRLFVPIRPGIFGIISILLAITASLVGTFNSYRTRVTNLDIPLNGLSRYLRAVHLSDIHIGHFRGKKFLQNIISLSNRQNPDLIFLTGDLFDGKLRISAEYTALLKNLKAPVFFVNGNHDGYSGVEKIKKLLRDVDIRVLENEVEQFGELQIIGLNHMRSEPGKADMHAGADGPTIKETLEKMQIKSSRPTVLLHHSPDGMEYASRKGVDLFLAGHTHAGQLFPINLLNNLLFKYNKGLHHSNGTKILVSQGVGTFGPPIRIGTKSEIISILLKPDNHD